MKSFVISIIILFKECPDDMIPYNDKCYHLSKDTVTWSDAKIKCEAYGSDYSLIVIDDVNENDMIKKRISVAGNHFETQFWIGLKQNDDQTRFTWVDGSDLSYGAQYYKDPWQNGEPNERRNKVISFEFNGQIKRHSNPINPKNTIIFKV